MKSYLLKDVVVVENFWRLFLCWFLVDFKCPAPYRYHYSIESPRIFSRQPGNGYLSNWLDKVNKFLIKSKGA